MTSSSLIDSINQVSTKTASSTSSSSKYNASDFMELLMTQLTHQNPLEPMDDSAMMSQMTQLNSLQSLQQIQSYLQQTTENNQKGYAASLIGKMALVNNADGDGNKVEGKVNGFGVESGKTYVQIGDKYYSLDNVTEVWEE